MKTFFRRLMCTHYWINEGYHYDPNTFESYKVGRKYWTLGTSVWGCKKCGKIKTFKFDFIPINHEETK